MIFIVSKARLLPATTRVAASWVEMFLNWIKNTSIYLPLLHHQSFFYRDFPSLEEGAISFWGEQLLAAAYTIHRLLSIVLHWKECTWKARKCLEIRIFYSIYNADYDFFFFYSRSFFSFSTHPRLNLKENQTRWWWPSCCVVVGGGVHLFTTRVDDDDE